MKNKLFTFGKSFQYVTNVSRFEIKNSINIQYKKMNFLTQKKFSFSFKDFNEKYNLKKYGYYGTAIYLGTFFTFLPTFYFLIKYNYINKLRLIDYLNKKGYEPQKYINRFGEEKTNFALAYLCHFITKPFRIIFSCAVAGYLLSPKKPKSKNPGMLRKYGAKGITVYSVMYIGGGVIIYGLIKTNIIPKNQIEVKIKSSEFLNKYYIKAKNYLGETGSDIAIAYIINYALEIIRLPLFIIIMKKLIKK